MFKKISQHFDCLEYYFEFRRISYFIYFKLSVSLVGSKFYIEIHVYIAEFNLLSFKFCNLRYFFIKIMCFFDFFEISDKSYIEYFTNVKYLLTHCFGFSNDVHKM
jgi:hypothetical protein